MPEKKLDFFFDGFLGVLGAVDEASVEGLAEECRMERSEGGSLGEGQNVDCNGDVTLVEIVVLERSVDTVLIDSVSDDLLRYVSLGRRRGAGCVDR